MKKILALLSLGVFLTGCQEEMKTAYVDTTVLIEEYSEMKKVEAEFTERSEALKTQLDSAARDFQQEVLAYQENMASMSQAERQETEARLMQIQQALQQQQQVMGGQLRQEGDAAIDSMITKVKEFVKVYGEENGYTYIFGSNESANIMFAEEGLDITDEILAELNAGEAPVEEEVTE